MAVRVGLISDTHGLLRPEALAALAGSDCILHAGDIGAPTIVEALARIAPVIAVRGNNDTAPWAITIPERATHTFERVRVLLTHDVASVDLAREAGDFDVLVVGHSHRPNVERRHGVLIVNPGSAGPRRFSLPIGLGSLHVDGAEARAELTTLAIEPPMAARQHRATR